MLPISESSAKLATNILILSPDIFYMVPGGCADHIESIVPMLVMRRTDIFVGV